MPFTIDNDLFENDIFRLYEDANSNLILKHKSTGESLEVGNVSGGGGSVGDSLDIDSLTTNSATVLNEPTSDTDVVRKADTELQDIASNLDQYTPEQDQFLRTTDTDELYRGDGSQWVKTDFGSFDSAQQYYVSPKGDDSANSGRSQKDAFASISRAVEQIQSDRGSTPSLKPEPASITIDSGEYDVDNPVRIPKNVSIVGTDLKSVQLYPEYPKLDFFHCDSMQYFEGLRFYDHQYPAWSFSFPRAIIEPTLNNSGELTDVQVLYSPTGYLEGDNSESPVAVVDPPRTGTQAEVDLTVSNGKITGATVAQSGSGYDTKPTISVPAPESDQPFLIASPYPTNCSSITGPFDVNGDEIPQDAPLPYDTSGFTYTDPIDGSQTTFGAVDELGAGGGILVDGRLCFGRNAMTDGSSTLPESPLNSFVTAQFTQVNQGGPGHAVINEGFAQFVSSFTTFCTYGFKTKTGGNALISNSVSDLGNAGLISEGRALSPYTTGNVVQNERSGVARIKINSGGSGYSSPTISIDGSATATATVTDGEITDVTVTDSGDDYTSTPSVTVTGSGTGADLEAEMDNVGQFTVENLDTTTQPSGNSVTLTPRLSSVVDITGESIEPKIVSYTDNEDGTYDVSISPAIDSIDSGENVELFELSVINSGGHLFEYPGTGVTYNALPENGGQTDYSQMVKEFGSGRVYHTSSDERGNFYVGDQFQVNQSTGTVTLNTDEFNLSGLNAVGPFTVEGVSRGVQLREVADRSDMVSNSGLDGNAAPTVRAVREYVQDIKDVLDTDISNLQSNKADSSTVSSHDHSEDSTGSSIPDDALVEDYLTSAPPQVDVSDGGSTVVSGVSGIDFDSNITVTDDGDGTVTVDGSSGTDTTVDVSDGGSEVVSQVTDINFGSNLSATDDGDGTVTADVSGEFTLPTASEGDTVGEAGVLAYDPNSEELLLSK